jgi:RluA family pseudouridine synthase
MTWENISDSFRDKKIRIAIEEKDRGKTIFDMLKQHMHHYCKEQWEQFFEKKEVGMTINGKNASPTAMLKARDEVVLTIRREAEPDVSGNYSIIYEDEHLLVVDKPSNLPVHPSGRFYGNTLVNMLKEKYPQLRIINRLDRQTSGIIIFAKDEGTAGYLAQQFVQKKVEKRYIAIVKGGCDIDDIIDIPIKESSYKEKCKMMIADEGGKPSQTKVRTMHKNKKNSILECKPITGRTHQIRVHLQHIGNPLINDTLYGGNPQDFIDELSGKRQYHPLMLHCHELTITDPYTEQKRTFESMVPRYMIAEISKKED